MRRIMKTIIAVSTIMLLITTVSANTLDYIQITGYDADTDYLQLMYGAAQDGSDYALSMGGIYEQQRNLKLSDAGQGDQATSCFVDYDNAQDILIAMNGCTESDVDLLARVLWLEAGSDWIPDNVIAMIASVVVNRVNSEDWPDTAKAVLYQKGQFIWTARRI